MQPKSLKNTGPMLPGFETLETVEPTTSMRLISFRPASRANLTAKPGSASGATMSGICGARLIESLASLGPNGCWLKMSQGYVASKLDGSLVKFSATWPRAGMMRNGKVYLLRPLVPLTSVIGCSLWPTPTAGDAKNRVTSERAKRLYSAGPSLIEKARCVEGRTDGYLNPRWVEYLMGLPLGWTEIDYGPSETQRYHK